MYIWGLPGGSSDKEGHLLFLHLLASAEDLTDTGVIPGLGRSLEEETATHSSILAWRIAPTEEPDGLQSTESQRVGHD